MGTTTGLRGSATALVRAYDCAMLDLDGVVYRGQQAIDGVPERLAEAASAGLRLAYVTNNAARPPDEVAAQLTRLGIPAHEQDVVTSAQAAAREAAKVAEPGSAVLVVGGPGLEQALVAHDLRPVRSAAERPQAVVQGFHPEVDWRQLAEGAFAVRAGATWIASNLDRTVPTANGVAPGNGTLVDAIAAAVDRRPDVVAGKPFRPLFDETVMRIGCSRPLVVGDRLDTDIEGANRIGADSLLVMTGVTDLVSLCAAQPQQRPTYLSWTLAGLLASHPDPVADSGGWRVNDWLVRLDGRRLVVVHQGSDVDDGLRATAAAAWAWRDDSKAPDTSADIDLEPLVALFGHYGGPHSEGSPP